MTTVNSNMTDRIASPRRPFDVEPALIDPGLTAMARGWAAFWSGVVLMRTANHWPGLVRRVKPFFVSMAWRTSGHVRHALLLNARRILGEDSDSEARTAFGKAVLASCYDSVCEIAGTRRISDRELQARIGQVIGRERYLQIRAQKRGAILVTAHLGAFETAVAALRRDESRVHIVFRRDPVKRFEHMRAAQRQRLGVVEAPVDDGLGVWVNLRDALLNDEVVLMQGDRVMPRQSGVRLPFFNGHMLFPSGPVKLAMMTGAPLVPIFAPRLADGRVRIILESPINIQSSDDDGGKDRALGEVAQVIERAVRAYPEQWQVLHRAFCEDEADSPS